MDEVKLGDKRRQARLGETMARTASGTGKQDSREADGMFVSRRLLGRGVGEEKSVIKEGSKGFKS